MRPKQAVAHIHTALDAHFDRRYPRGARERARARAEAAIGKRPGFLRKVKSAGRLRLADLAGVLESEDLALGDLLQRAVLEPGATPFASLAPLVDPATVTPAALHQAGLPAALDPVHRFLLDAERAEARLGTPRTVAAVRARHDAGLLRDGAPPDAVRRRLDELEVLLYDDPAAAGRQAEAIARRARSLRGAVLALSLWTSSLRRCQRLGMAAVVLGAGLSLARAHGDRCLEARLARRGAYLLSDRAQHRRGLRLAEHALLLWTELGDLELAARAQLDRGVVARYLGDSEAARTAFRAALRWLPADARLPRLAALHGLGFAYFELGELDRAADLAARAIAAADGVTGGHIEGRLIWLQAMIADARGELGAAEALYRRTLDAFAAFPGDALQVAAELIRVVLRQGRALEARQLARSLTWLVIPLEDDSVLHACVADLIRAGMESDRLTRQLIESTIEGIRRARGAAPAPA